MWLTGIIPHLPIASHFSDPPDSSCRARQLLTKTLQSRSAAKPKRKSKNKNNKQVGESAALVVVPSAGRLPEHVAVDHRRCMAAPVWVRDVRRYHCLCSRIGHEADAVEFQVTRNDSSAHPLTLPLHQAVLCRGLVRKDAAALRSKYKQQYLDTSKLAHWRS